MIDSTVITYADPKTSDTISEMEFNSMLQHSYEQALAGEGRPIEDVFTDLERFFLQPSLQAIQHLWQRKSLEQFYLFEASVSQSFIYKLLSFFNLDRPLSPFKFLF